jgi:hypothetical protein
MTHEAASQFEISEEPSFSLDILRSLCTEVDALLGFLLSESKTEEAENDAPIRKPPAETVRGERATHRLGGRPKGRSGSVPRGCRQAMARRTRGRSAAGALLSHGVHAAGADRRHRLSEQGGCLRHPVQGVGRDADHHRGRPEACVIEQGRTIVHFCQSFLPGVRARQAAPVGSLGRFLARPGG